ncbi:hypothetical protein [Halalkalibacter oceani]|uniref:hypothetical protein n=1 Tax=Halalkalibacter oceani TaxID=1653776 RepID=UPI0033941B67
MKELMDKEIAAIVHEYIFLSLARKVLERDKDKIKQSEVKIKTPYIELIDEKIIQLSKDLRDVKVEMNKKGIKIHKVNELRYSVHYKGYQREVGYMGYAMRTYVEEIMKRYFLQKN